MMERVSLNDYLSTKSNWPRRLLGWERYEVRRDAEHVTDEYDNERYSPLLALTSTDVEDYKRTEFDLLSMPQDGPQHFSIGEEVFVGPLTLLRRLWYATIADAVAKYRGDLLCELGCGYGFNLSYLGGAV